jgi:isochorismate pyruvate lyase
MDLSRIRKNIDDIDAMIITLLAKRADMVSAAGRLKKSEQCVRDPKRVNQVLRNVRERAEAKGLDPAVAEEVYRTIIHCFVSRELTEVAEHPGVVRGGQCR